MSFSIEFADETQEYQARIKVIGCGGSGGNAVNTMINFGLEGVEFIVVNTDAQALNSNAAPTKLSIGSNVTRGLGAGADPDKGRKAALEDVQRIKELISGADMVFVTAGMGGGTGTGAAPIIAQLAREEGALTVGVVTKPFLFEGRQRARRAELGLAQLAEHVDTLITIPKQKLLLLGDDDLTFIDACRKADEVLCQRLQDLMFVFEDLLEIDDRGIQELLREVDTNTLVLALKAAVPAMRDKFLSNMSQRAAEMLKDDLESRGPVKLSEVETSQKLILQTVRKLAEDGRIILQNTGEEFV
jgi:cell division protein FtsZ